MPSAVPTGQCDTSLPHCIPPRSMSKCHAPCLAPHLPHAVCSCNTETHRQNRVENCIETSSHELSKLFIKRASSNMPSSLNKLPAEILLQILYGAAELSLQDLLSLSRVNRRFQSIYDSCKKPLLHHTPIFSIGYQAPIFLFLARLNYASPNELYQEDGSIQPIVKIGVQVATNFVKGCEVYEVKEYKVALRLFIVLEQEICQDLERNGLIKREPPL